MGLCSLFAASTLSPPVMLVLREWVWQLWTRTAASLWRAKYIILTGVPIAH